MWWWKNKHIQVCTYIHTFEFSELYCRLLELMQKHRNGGWWTYKQYLHWQIHIHIYVYLYIHILNINTHAIDDMHSHNIFIFIRLARICQILKCQCNWATHLIALPTVCYLDLSEPILMQSTDWQFLYTSIKYYVLDCNLVNEVKN